MASLWLATFFWTFLQISFLYIFFCCCCCCWKDQQLWSALATLKVKFEGSQTMPLCVFLMLIPVAQLNFLLWGEFGLPRLLSLVTSCSGTLFLINLKLTVASASTCDLTNQLYEIKWIWGEIKALQWKRNPAVWIGKHKLACDHDMFNFRSHFFQFDYRFILWWMK